MKPSPTIFLAGHSSFGNRGCEALIRSLTGLFRKIESQATFLCPSASVDHDRRHWPHCDRHGIEFVADEPLRQSIRWWGRAHRVTSLMERLPKPRIRPSAATAAAIRRSDAVVVTGGDIISLEYGLPSLYHWMGVVDYAISLGRSPVLWGASVGPFSSRPAVERDVVRHLRRYAVITARETQTFGYLKSLGLDNVTLVSDPAFTLVPEPLDMPFMAADGGVLGLNVSPLVRQFRDATPGDVSLEAHVAQFIRQTLERTRYRIVLVPHVDPADGGSWNSDSTYLETILGLAGGPSERLQLLPRTLNAAQLKHVLARCRFFIGARTHATIAALSSEVPTMSIAYSVKARGINQDLFGDTRYVVDIRDVTAARLTESVNLLERDQSEICALLRRRIPEWRNRAAIPAEQLARVLRSRECELSAAIDRRAS
jgi:colanic acid/amylovoran biosynthesis protein